MLRHYLCGWFLVDFVACFPTDWLYLAICHATGGKVAWRTLLWLRALRLLRVLRLMTHRRVFTYLLHTVFSRLKIRASYLTILQRTLMTIMCGAMTTLHPAHRPPPRHCAVTAHFGRPSSPDLLT